MALHKPNTDITIRGGLINYPAAQIPTPPPRHQPDTPRTKKQTQVRPDHQTPSPAPEPIKDQPQPEPSPNPTPEIPEQLA